jgi:hypothetical protein
MCSSGKNVHRKGGTCECCCLEVCAVLIYACIPPLDTESPPSKCNSNLITYAGVTELW